MGTSVASSGPLNGGQGGHLYQKPTLPRRSYFLPSLSPSHRALWISSGSSTPSPKKCAEIGEEVTFNWGGSGHNVVEVKSKKDFDDCTGFVESNDGENGPVTVSFDKKGKYYFVCGVGGHCLHGNQKVEVIVRDRCSSTNPSRG